MSALTYVTVPVWEVAGSQASRRKQLLGQQRAGRAASWFVSFGMFCDYNKVNLLLTLTCIFVAKIL